MTDFVHQRGARPQHGQLGVIEINGVITFDAEGARRVDRALERFRAPLPEGFPATLPGSEVEVTEALRGY